MIQTFEARYARQREQCKGPEAGAHMACLGNTKEASVAGAEVCSADDTLVIGPWRVLQGTRLFL